MKNIFIYIILSFASSLILLFLGGRIESTIAQLTPGLAVVVIFIFSKNKREIITNTAIFKMGKFVSYLLSIILPFFTIVLSYNIANYFGYLEYIGVKNTAINLQTIKWLLEMLYQVVMIAFPWPFLFAFFEELGWRGFLLPKLQSVLSLDKALVLSSIIWAVWHYSFIFLDEYYESGNIVINTLLFTLAVSMMGITIGWIRIKSDSLWPCVLFHALSNTSVMLYSNQFKVIDQNYIYIAGEAGIVNIIYWAILALLIYWKLRKSSKCRMLHHPILKHLFYL